MDAFRDRVALVTGGASGIGEALARALAGRGARVAVADRNDHGAERVAAEIREGGGDAVAAPVDVAVRRDVHAVVEGVVRRWGRLDSLFACAGVAIAAEVRDMKPEHWDRVLGVDLLGIVHGVEAAYPVMIRQGSGHIVNVASMAGLVPHPMSVAYCAAKFGVVGLSLALRAEAAPLGVRVSVVCPGYVETPIFDSAITERIRMQDLMERFPFRPCSAERAAREILRGAERNRARIVFPLHARLADWIQRAAPGLIERLNRRSVKHVHEVRGGD